MATYTRIGRKLSVNSRGKYVARVATKAGGRYRDVRRAFDTEEAARVYLAEMECARAGYLARHDFRRLIPVDTITDIVTTANDYRPWDLEEGASDSDSVTAYLTGRRTR